MIAILLLVVPISRTRAEEVIRLDLRLLAADLVDELVYTWIQNPPFAAPTAVVLAEISAPIGIDQRFNETIENHLYEVLRANPTLPIELVHCSFCHQWVAATTREKTVIGRGIDQPGAAAQLSQFPAPYALSLHFDVIDRELFLRAELFETKSPQKIFWAKRFLTSTARRALLREPRRLVSIDEARAEQTRLLQGRDTIRAVTRVPVRNFVAKDKGVGSEIPPLIFLEQSFEAVLAPHYDRRLGVAAGITSIKGSHQGWSVGGYFQQLIGRPEPNLMNPDLYFRAGVNYFRLEGPGATVFSQGQLDVARLVNSKEPPRASLTSWQVGLEAHVKHRFGLSAFVEYVPVLNKSQVIETQRLLLPFHTYGVALVLQW